jgi:hypothetical protein
MRAGRRRALVGIITCLAVFLSAAAPLRAADDGEDRPLELWLDRPLPEDVPAGTEIPIGVMVWDTLAHDLVRNNPPFVRLNPAEGDGEPSMVTLVEDWSGHYSESIVVPDGGMGAFEAGFGGTACDETSCQSQETLFPIGGVGPPPDAPLPSIAQAEIVMDGTPTAGQPTRVSIHLQPNEGWSGETFATPDQLILQVREPRAEVIDQVPAPLGALPLRYEAELTLTEPGDYVLEVAEDRGGADGEVFGASLIPITASAAPTQAAPDATAGPSLEALVLVGLVAFVVLAAGTLLFAIRRA